MYPKFKILANNNDITNLLNGRLMSLSISDEIGLVSDSLTIELDDRDCILDVPACGAELEVFLGYDELYTMGKFVVDEIELKNPPQTISITARASNAAFEDIGSFKSPRSYSWENYTLKGIIQTVAKRYRLTESMATDFAGIMVSHIDQTDESDCAFIQRVASEYNASIKIAGGKLLFISPLSGKFPDGTDLPAIPINQNIINYQMRIAERGKYKKVIAKYYDFDEAEEKKVSAGSGSPAFTLRDTYTSANRASLQAKRKLKEITTGTKTLSLELIGNPLVSAESVIQVSGVRPEVAGLWVVKAAQHTFSSSGYKTRIDAVRKE